MEQHIAEAVIQRQAFEIGQLRLDLTLAQVQLEEARSQSTPVEDTNTEDMGG